MGGLAWKTSGQLWRFYRRRRNSERHNSLRAARTSVMMDCLIASGSVAHASTITAKSASLGRLSVGNAWARLAAEILKPLVFVGPAGVAPTDGLLNR